MEETPTQQHSQSVGQLMDSYWDAVAKRSNAIPTGVDCLDTALGGGLKAGKLFALLGGPGIGKTALANQIAEYVADSGRPVLYLSFEEGWTTMLQRIISRIGDIDYGKVVHESETYRKQINEAFETIRKRSSLNELRYIDHYVSLKDLRDESQAHFTGKESGLVVVDYLQHWARAIRHKESDRRDLRESVTALAENLRVLAQDLGCAVLMLASQHRGGYANTEKDNNAITSAKESGDIEYCSDVLMALDPDKLVASPEWESRKLHIAKNRLGSTGTYPLEWRGNRQEIRDPKYATASEEDEISWRRDRRSKKSNGGRSFDVSAPERYATKPDFRCKTCDKKVWAMKNGDYVCNQCESHYRKNQGNRTRKSA